MSNLARGYGIAVTCAVVLSTTAVFIRFLTQAYRVPPLVLAFWRDLFTVLTMVAALGATRPALLLAGRGRARYLVAYGFILAVFNSLWTLSVFLNGAAVATVLAYSSAAFTALLGWWLLKERLDAAKILAVAVCIAGCALISGASDPAAWRANPAGIFTGVVSGLCYAGYSLMGRFTSQRGLNPWTTLTWTFAIASVLLLLVNLVPGGLLPGAAARPAELMWLGKSFDGWGVLFLLAAGPTVLGFGLYNVSLVYLPSSVVNLVATLEPACTAAIAFFLLGERMSRVQVAGSLMIAGGVVLLRLYEGWAAAWAAGPEGPAQRRGPRAASRG